MDRLANLTVEKKVIVLKGLIFAFFALNLGLSYWIFSRTGPEVPQSIYKESLQAHINEYLPIEDKYEQFSFYENYDNLLYDNRELNEDYREGVRTFSNITQKQFYSLYQLVSLIAQRKKFGEIAKFEFDYYDWSQKHVLIRDERGFNISHIFAALTSIEYQINENQTISEKMWIALSAQEIIDCCPECLTNKKPETVFKYIKQFGVTTEDLYPYENNIFDKEPRDCRRDNFNKSRFFIRKYKTLKGCGNLQTYLTKGPLVVSVDSRNFNRYHYGIFDECERKRTHYATIVGINYDSWKLQNSWGRKWGENGYLRIGPGDTCGVCLHPTVAFLKTE